MATPDYRMLRKAFRSLGERSGWTLRADHCPGGWGRSARKLLERIDSGDPDFQHLTDRRSELNEAAAASPWLLIGAPMADKEFALLATSGATLTGAVGVDGWLDRLLGSEIYDGREVYESDGERLTVIPNVLATSVEYCRLLELSDGPVVDPCRAEAALDESKPLTENRRRYEACKRRVRESGGGKLTQKRFLRVAGYEGNDTTQLRHWLNEHQQRMSHASKHKFNNALMQLENNPHAGSDT
jgi:hypothetical protein